MTFPSSETRTGTGGSWVCRNLPGGSVGTINDVPTTNDYERPNAISNPATVTINGHEYDVAANFSDTANAYDEDEDTYSEGRNVYNQGPVTAIDWTFPVATPGGVAGPLTSDYNLTVKAEVTGSSLPIPDKASCYIQVTLDGGGTWDTIFSGHPDEGTSIQYMIPSGQSMTLFRVRAILYYPVYAQTQWVYFRIKEIEAQSTGVGGAAQTSGTHYYCCTEELTISLASGKTIVIESGPSTFLSVTTTTATTGVRYTLPNQVNVPARGYDHDDTLGLTLQRRIYRSTKTGAPPDLGYIATVPIDTVRYIDYFGVSQITLGTPSINTVWLEDAYYNMSEPPPAIYDACVHNGAIVMIPVENRTQVRWSPPGYPEYYPTPQSFPFLFQAKDYEGQGVVSLGDNLLIFLRNGIKRIRNLPFITSPNFLIDDIEIDDLSPSVGLAGSPKGYCFFHSQKGHGVVGFVADSGVWMTDGALVSERGLGLVKLTSHKDWRGDVDLSRLDESELTFDPELQTLIFDYYDSDGTRVSEFLHIAAEHWIQSGEDQMVPKITGPHSLTAVSRATGENNGEWRHWSLPTSPTKVLSERTGIKDDTSNILTHIETGWIYPVGPGKSFQAYAGWLYHTDWGAGEACDVAVMIRRDNSGIVQHLNKRNLSLRGDRTTQLGYLNGSGQAVKITIRHNGPTVSDGSSRRAFGPVALEIEPTDERRKD